MGIFNKDHYPTPESAIYKMTAGLPIHGKTILEPSVGSGNIVNFLYENGAAEVLGCEIDPVIRNISGGICRLVEFDFLDVTPEQISHIDYIIMNPPYSADEQHILHAWSVAPAGCEIRALCNFETIRNLYTKKRLELHTIIKEHGDYKSIGRAFDGNDAERSTTAEICLISLKKPGKIDIDEFDGFFMTDEEEEAQDDALRPYNFIRDLVNRYIGAVKIYDEQMETAIRMNDLTKSFFSSRFDNVPVLSMDGKQVQANRETYKKELQKSAWNYVIKKFNLEKFLTQAVEGKINKFVEQNKTYPFTMKNIYRMVEILIGTVNNRMDEAVVKVFDSLTSSTFENRYNIEGFKTNSNYLVNQKFIMTGLFNFNYHAEINADNDRRVVKDFNDMMKAICYIEGVDYDKLPKLSDFLTQTYRAINKHGEYVIETTENDYGLRHDLVGTRTRKKDRDYDRVLENFEKMCDENGYTYDQKPVWGEKFDYTFFEIRGYKKGTAHITFKDVDVWARFNQHVAKIKGFVLPDQHDFGSNKRNTKARKAKMKK